MLFGVDFIHELETEACSEFDGVRSGFCEDAIIETAAAPYPRAGVVKAETGAEKKIDFRGFHKFEAFSWLEDSESACDEILGRAFYLIEDQIVPNYLRKNPDPLPILHERVEIHLPRQGGIDGDHTDIRALLEIGPDLPDNDGGVALVHLDATPQILAKAALAMRLGGMFREILREQVVGICHLPVSILFPSSNAMNKFWQFTILAAFALTSLCAEEKAKFSWEPLEIRKSIFSQDIVMLDSERDEYASNLAAYAANKISESGASMASVAHGRKALALAMHLSPRNKQALVTQFQLAKGIVPGKTESDYSPQVFARLLLTRGQLLLQQPEGENTQLAHYMIQLAAEIDPRNDDAVYASELIRLDTGGADWERLAVLEKKPVPVTEKE